MTTNKKPADKRRDQREVHWPGSDGLVWSAKQGKGFFSAPRTISLVATLIRLLSPRLDPSRVYIDLWSRNFDEGIVDVVHEQDMAAACGYMQGTRSVRTWRERVDALVKLGFIRIAPSGTRSHGHILLLHPDRVVATLRQKPGTSIPQSWLSLYDNRLRETGASPGVPFEDGAA